MQGYTFLKVMLLHCKYISNITKLHLLVMLGLVACNYAYFTVITKYILSTFNM